MIWPRKKGGGRGENGELVQRKECHNAKQGGEEQSGLKFIELSSSWDGGAARSFFAMSDISLCTC